MPSIRIAERYTDDGEPIYTKTIPDILAELAQADAVSEDDVFDEAAAYFQDVLKDRFPNVCITNEGTYESRTISDAFFNAMRSMTMRRAAMSRLWLILRQPPRSSMPSCHTASRTATRPNGS